MIQTHASLPGQLEIWLSAESIITTIGMAMSPIKPCASGAKYIEFSDRDLRFKREPLSGPSVLVTFLKSSRFLGVSLLWTYDNEQK